jgi:hypothetical protein
MKTTKRLLTLAAVLVLLLSIAGMAAAGVDCSNDKFSSHPQCTSDPEPTTTTTTEPSTAQNCAHDIGAQIATDGVLELPAGGSENWCDDISNEENGSEIRFDFTVTPTDKPLRAGFVLGIRNSIPGDWCGGLWSLYDHSGTPVFQNAPGNAINPSTIGDGWYATLVIDEPFAPDGNCTAEGDLLWYDNDPNWVITLGGGAGRPLKGNESITVTWSPWNQPTP